MIPYDQLQRYENQRDAFQERELSERLKEFEERKNNDD